MTNILDFENNFLFYQKYHKNTINKIIHIICIPLITWSLSVLLFNIKINNIRLSKIILTFYKIYYLILSFKYGLLMMIILDLIYKLSKFFVTNYNNHFKIAFMIQITSWILQFIGHGLFEGKKPALIDNLVQAFLIAPMFVLIDVLSIFGYKLDKPLTK